MGEIGSGMAGSRMAHEVLTLVLAILLLVTLVDIVGQIARARILDAPVVGAAPAEQDSPTPQGSPAQQRSVLGRALAFFGRGDA